MVFFIQRRPAITAQAGISLPAHRCQRSHRGAKARLLPTSRKGLQTLTASLSSLSSEPTHSSASRAGVLLRLPKAPEELRQGGLSHEAFIAALTARVGGSFSKARTRGLVLKEKEEAAAAGGTLVT